MTNVRRPRNHILHAFEQKQQRDSNLEVNKYKNNMSPNDFNQFIETQVGDQIDTLVQQKEISYPYLTSESHALHPRTKGNFLRYQSLQFPERLKEVLNTQRFVISGFLEVINCAYFAWQNRLILWSFNPTQDQLQDLNFYYNPNNQYQFPGSLYEQELQLDSEIVALSIGFSDSRNQYVLCICSQFQITKFILSQQNGIIQNDLIPQNFFLNTNGEIIHQIKVLQDGIIYGGSLGVLQRVFFNDMEQSRHSQSFGKKIFSDLKTSITHMDDWIRSKQYKVIQIELDCARKLCYALIEITSGKKIETMVSIYDLGYFGDEFKLKFKIEQNYLANQVQDRNLLFDDFHLQYIKHIAQPEYFLLLYAKSSLQIAISLDIEQLQQDEMRAKLREKQHLFNEPIDLQNFTLKSLNMQLKISEPIRIYKLTGSITLKCMRFPIPQMDPNTSYGVFVDRWTNFVQDIQGFEKIRSPNKIDAVYADESLLMISCNGSLTISLPDQGHIAYVNQQFSNFQYRDPMDHSIYKNCSYQAYEIVDLEGAEASNIQSTIMKMNSPPHNHYACLNKQGLYFLIQFRPIDVLFMSLKVTNEALMVNQEVDYPLEKFINAYGVQGCCVLLLELMCKADEMFYVNTELEKHYQTSLQDLIMKNERTQFFSEQELTPIWVTGKVYVMPGNVVLAKANKYYNMLVRRAPKQDKIVQMFGDHRADLNILILGEHCPSQKLMSFVAYTAVLLRPIWNEKIFEWKSVSEFGASLNAINMKDVHYAFKKVGELMALLTQDQIVLTTTKQASSERVSRGFDVQKFKRFGQDQCNPQDMNGQDVELDLENFLVQKLQTFLHQVQQFLECLIYIFEDLQDLRSVLMHLRALDLTMCFSSIFKNTQSSQSLMVMKLILVEVINTQEFNKLERGREFCSRFPVFFDEYDYTIALVQCGLREIFQRLLVSGTFEEQNNLKMNQFFKLFTHQEKQVVNRAKVYVYYKTLPPTTVNELMDLYKTIQDSKISSQRIQVAIRPYFFPLGMIAQYYSLLLLRASHLNQLLQKDVVDEVIKSSKITKKKKVEHQIQIENEFQQLVECLQNEITAFMLVYLTSKDKIVDENLRMLSLPQLEMIFNQVLQALMVYPLFPLHEHVIKFLYAQDAPKYIRELKSPYMMDISLGEHQLDRLKLMQECSVDKDDHKQVVLLSLELFCFVLFVMPQNIINLEADGYSFEQTVKNLSIKARMQYLNQARDHLSILKKDSSKSVSDSYIKDTFKQIAQLDCNLTLQDIVYRTLRLSNASQEEDMLSVVREVTPFQVLEQFIFDNQMFLYQVLVMDYRYYLNMDVVPAQFRETYEMYFESPNIDQTWPSPQLENELSYLYDHLKVKQTSFNVLQLVELVEGKNYQRLPFNDERASWFLRFLFTRVRSGSLLEAYQNILQIAFEERSQKISFAINQLLHLLNLVLDQIGYERDQIQNLLLKKHTDVVQDMQSQQGQLQQTLDESKNYLRNYHIDQELSQRLDVVSARVMHYFNQA